MKQSYSVTKLVLALIFLSSSAMFLMTGCPPPVTVPDVAGMTLASATTAIEYVGLVVGDTTEQNSASVPAGQVISQDPVAGTTANTGEDVDLVVSLGNGGEGEGEGEITITLPGGVLLEMVWIPSGSFQMGRYSDEQGIGGYSLYTEDPQHTVNIAYDFYMGKYEVTQAQWLALVGSWPGTVPEYYGVGDTYPAYFISWNDAQNFISALNNHISSTGQGSANMRLPSEAEWEYACRAGTSTRFYFGDSLGCASDYCTDCAAGMLPGNRSDFMWYCGNNDPSGRKPVGGKLPNAFGLYDMSGNVAEWCQDWMHNNYTGAPVDGSAWELPSGSYRVVRGGFSSGDAFLCRSASRSCQSQSYRDDTGIGFRLALVR